VADKSEYKEQAPSRVLGTLFKQMNQGRKIRFVLQQTVCVLSFEFIFPNMMSS